MLFTMHPNGKDNKMSTKTYSWTMPGYFNITAEQAHNEIARLEKATPHNIVELARDEKSILHNYFEWDNEIAGEKYREEQAKLMLRCIIVHEEKEDDKETTVRAWISTTEKYVYDRVEAVLSNEKEYENMLKTALRELESFKRKYKSLKELKPLFDVIDKI